MRGRNTENLIVEKALEMAGYQQKRYVIMKFIHEEKYIAFHDIGKGRRKKEILDGLVIIVALSA